MVNTKKIFMLMFLVSHFCKMLFCVELSAQLPLGDYKYFTPERRVVLAKMGDFFDETVRNNFPAETDTLSYQYFFSCIETGALNKKRPVILFVNRDKLNEINQTLFKDANYYFFYMYHIALQSDRLPNGVDGVALQNGVPVYVDFSDPSHNEPASALLGAYLNMKGYVSVLTSDNPFIREMLNLAEISGDIGLLMYVSRLLHVHLNEISDKDVKRMGAVLFWRYLCYCGGIDLVERKGFCEICKD